VPPSEDARLGAASDGLELVSSRELGAEVFNLGLPFLDDPLEVTDRHPVSAVGRLDLAAVGIALPAAADDVPNVEEQFRVLAGRQEMMSSLSSSCASVSADSADAVAGDDEAPGLLPATCRVEAAAVQRTAMIRPRCVECRSAPGGLTSCHELTATSSSSTR
jgi:hypothetical protein